MIVRDVDALRRALGDIRPAFVPTMGALHEGHLALIRRAAQHSAGAPIVASIFVNPTQFGPNEDFTRYPRMLEQDSAAAFAAGGAATIIFAPDVEAIYPPHAPPPVPDLPEVATQPQLEDAYRPGHFAGVCQVVARLFDLVQPSLAVFGEKDYQQLLVIHALVKQEGDRWPGLRIVPHETVREPDGLAMSSRNMYLKPRQRDAALGLFRALRAAQGEVREHRTPEAIENLMRSMLHEHGLLVDYAAVRDAQTLLPVASAAESARALIAARLDAVRLIDNMPLT